MRRGDHDAGVAVEMADREGEQGGGAVIFEDDHLETRRRKDARAELGELGGMVPGVAGDHAGPARVRTLFAVT